MDTNIRQDAYDQIKYNIVHFHSLPRQKVSEKSIAASLNLGRTPVREALIRMEREGLINVVPQSGTYIATIDMNIVKEGRFVRECIEPQVMMEALVKHSSAQFETLWQNLNAPKKLPKQIKPTFSSIWIKNFIKLFTKLPIAVRFGTGCSLTASG